MIVWVDQNTKKRAGADFQEKAKETSSN